MKNIKRIVSNACDELNVDIDYFKDSKNKYDELVETSLQYLEEANGEKVNKLQQEYPTFAQYVHDVEIPRNTQAYKDAFKEYWKIMHSYDATLFI